VHGARSRSMSGILLEGERGSGYGATTETNRSSFNAEDDEKKELKVKVGEESDDDDDDDDKENSATAKFAVTASWIANWFLLGAKLYLFIATGSKSVLAALADSVVDLVSQAVLALAERYQALHHDEYPVGRSRLEALSVIALGMIMAFANIEVIQYSIATLVDGVNGDIPSFDTYWYTYTILGIGILMKFLLWRYCTWAQNSLHLSSDMLDALAEDHLNDVMSNSVAVITLAIAAEVDHDPNLWWVDASGAILISSVIVIRWWNVGMEQVNKLIGLTAPPEFIEQVESIAASHGSGVEVDCTRVYYCGSRYHVEMEIVLDGSTPLTESHDVALIIQHRIEKLPEVERAFVHVDYQKRDGLEHKIERQLITGSSDFTSISPGGVHAMVSKINKKEC